MSGGWPRTVLGAAFTPLTPPVPNTTATRSKPSLRHDNRYRSRREQRDDAAHHHGKRECACRQSHCPHNANESAERLGLRALEVRSRRSRNPNLIGDLGFGGAAREGEPKSPEHLREPNDRKDRDCLNRKPYPDTSDAVDHGESPRDNIGNHSGWRREGEDGQCKNRADEHQLVRVQANNLVLIPEVDRAGHPVRQHADE